MKHLIVYLFLFGILIASPVYAQFPLLSLTSDNQQLVEFAVKGGVVLLEQSYQLKDTTTHQRFGRYGKEEFGKSYSLSVKLDGGLFVMDNAVRPWDYDENYARYRESYRPVLHKTYYKELTDSVMSEITLDYSQPKRLGKSMVYHIEDSLAFHNRGYSINCNKGKQKGWVVWITSTMKIEEYATQNAFSYIIYRREIDFSSDSISYAINPPQTERNVWGGIFVVPKQTAIGQLTFKLCGIMVQENDSWRLVVPFAEVASTEFTDIVGEELTPATNSSSEAEPTTDGTDKKKKNKKKNKKDE